jgi:prepilin-type processing-associated H-X9-DG protein
MQCGNNLKQIGLAMHNYESATQLFPPGRMGCDCITNDQCAGKKDAERPGTSGLAMILPQLEQQALYDQFAWERGAVYPADCGDSTESGWDTAAVKAAMLVRPPMFGCPSDTSKKVSDASQAATGSYALVNGSNGPSSGLDTYKIKLNNTGMFNYAVSYTMAHMTDGTSNTLIAGEVIEAHTSQSSNRWMVASRHSDVLRSTENPINTQPGKGVVYSTLNAAFASRHPGGAHFAFADGHVAFLNDNINLTVYRALSTRSGGETVTAP